jgi:hypothetical protein
MWYFCGFRETAIRRLSEKNDFWTVTSVERIVLARKYKVPAWLIQGLRELAEENVLVTRNNAKKIGFETAFVVAHICFGDKHWSKKDFKDYGDWVKNRVAIEFKAEIRELGQDASAYVADPVDSRTPVL